MTTLKLNHTKNRMPVFVLMCCVLVASCEHNTDTVKHNTDTVKRGIESKVFGMSSIECHGGYERIAFNGGYRGAMVDNYDKDGNKIKCGANK